MSTNQQKSNWILDALLFTGFVIAFVLDLTGLSLHQWLGVLIGLFAFYHLILHWDWVIAVGLRFWGKTSAQARLYYLLDGLLLFGLFLIIGSGLVVSTWFNLNQSQSGASSAKSHSNNTIYLRAGSCFRRDILKGLLRFFGDMDHISPKIMFNTFLDAIKPKSIQYYSVLMIILRNDVNAGSPRSVTSRIICRLFPANPYGMVIRQLG